MWTVSAFSGRNRLTVGFRVERRQWFANPYRPIHQIAAQFFGTVSEAGRTKAKADTLAAKLNAIGYPPILSHKIH